MRNILAFIVLVLTISSCSELPVAVRYQKDFTNCYDFDTTDLKSKLRFDGYYQFRNADDRDTSHLNFIFFSDGTFVDNVIFPDYFPLWGIYKTQNDTVITQYMNITYGSPRVVWESWYQIVTPEKLKLIYTSKLGDEVTVRHMYYSSEAVREDTAAIFINSENIPGPDSWLKEEEWTDCSERVLKKYPFRLTEILQDGDYSGHYGPFYAYVRVHGSKAYARVIYRDKSPHFVVTDTINLSGFQSMSILGEKFVLFKRKNKLYLGNRDNNEVNAFVIPIKPDKGDAFLSENKVDGITMKEGIYRDKAEYFESYPYYFQVRISKDSAIVDAFTKPKYRSEHSFSDTLYKTDYKPALFSSKEHLIYYNRGKFYLGRKKGEYWTNITTRLIFKSNE